MGVVLRRSRAVGIVLMKRALMAGRQGALPSGAQYGCCALFTRSLSEASLWQRWFGELPETNEVSENSGNASNFLRLGLLTT